MQNSKFKIQKVLIVFALCSMLFAPIAKAQFVHTVLDSVKAGTTSSAAIDLEGYTLAGIEFPATFTGATVTITTSADTVTANFKTIQYDGADVSLTATDGKYCQFKPVETWGVLRYIKIVSASTEAATRNVIIRCVRF
ncbi:MAG: hypothetical protein IPL84_03830 [Chitinophagaceae bacterium]|nr:hypothetical protein [Chitinophagaceae bacterium]